MKSSKWLYTSRTITRRTLPSSDSYLPGHLLSLSCTESYSHVTATSHTSIDSSRPADSKETLADSIRPVVIELPQLLVSSPGGVPTDVSLVTATGGPQP